MTYALEEYDGKTSIDSRVITNLRSSSDIDALSKKLYRKVGMN